MANVFCIGNGTSRKGFDLETLKPFGKTYACNAIYKDFIPDVLITVDQGIMHEVYHSGYAQRHEMWCRGWTKVPAGTYKLMLNSGLPQEEVDKLLEDDILQTNEKGNAEYFVMHGSNLQGMATIIKQNKKRDKEWVNKSKVYVSWINTPEYSNSLDDIMEEKPGIMKDLGWSAGPTSGYVACKQNRPEKAFLIGHDLYSDTAKVNNLYAGRKHYVTKEHGPTPCENWIRQWKALFEAFPDTTFYKVNSVVYGKDRHKEPTNKTDLPIEEWKDIKNLLYIDYPEMVAIFDK
tara:strand:+ start:289 stop:1158 length:870 start_codon:yes stop_codon:yes gene_type:complete